MRLNFLVIGVVACCGVLPACDDATVLTEPSSFKNELNFTPLGSPQLTWSIANPCSSVVPLPGPLTLHVAAGPFPLTLSEVRFQALDPFRSTAPPIIFDSASLTRQFGSITIERFAIRQFPFAHPFGCLKGTVLQTSVTTTDNGGVSRVQTMPVPGY